MSDGTPTDRSGTVPALPVPPKNRNGPGGRLPVPLTSFVGREPEVAAVCTILRHDGVRLVTLTGPGGVGKTRLALCVAKQLATEYADGVAFVALAAVIDPDLVPPTIARALGAQETGDRPITERLAETLQGRRLLLVLDNFEHILAAAPFVAGLLAACSELTLLVTSRAILRLSGEHVYPVPPLAVPDAATAPAQALDTEAVRLFAERARAADLTFAVNADDAPVVAAICARLDGLPLAIELAAAKTRLLLPRTLLARLAERLPLLSGGPRDLPERQRTMRDTIAWSHDLLVPQEQALFRRLAVFAGGFTLEAAAVVANGGGQSDTDVLAGVEALAEQSLIRRLEDTVGESRLGMLETVREFGLEQLAANGETATVHDAHAAYYLALVEPVDPHLLMPGQERLLVQFEAEHANLRAALTWLEHRSQPEQHLRLAAGLRWFWYIHGHYSEGRNWLERALAMGDRAPTIERARALTGLGALTLYQGEYQRAEAVFRESLALCTQLDDQREAAVTLLALGMATYAIGDYVQATAQTDEALAVFRALGDPVFASNALENLGEIAHAQGDATRAIARFEEALALQRASGFTWGAIQSLWGLGNVARDGKNHAEAMDYYRESLALAWDHADTRWIAYGLAGVAVMAIAQEETEAAARLFGAVEALLERIGAAILPVDRAAYDQGIAAVRATLGDEGYAAARLAGRALPLEQAIAEAGAIVPISAPPSTASEPRESHGLTARETEILRLLSVGRTDREIAAALFVSPRTVNGHTARLYTKLGVGSRSEATAWAVRHGLA